MRWNDVQEISVAPVSTTTVYSQVFDLANAVKLGLELVAAGSAIDVLVKLLISHDGDNYAIEDGYSNIVNLTSTTRSRKSIHDTAIPPAKYGKLSFTGQNANAANVAVTGNINIIREITQ